MLNWVNISDDICMYTLCYCTYTHSPRPTA